jgi:serine protein kinase
MTALAASLASKRSSGYFVAPESKALTLKYQTRRLRMAEIKRLVGAIASLQDQKEYADLNWEGSFEEYLQIVRDNPKVIRTAYQRLYDMILSYGREEYLDNKKKIIRYNFFRDENNNGKDAIYGLDIPLMRLVNIFKAAAMGYGPEKRIIMLHGPVGSSKSTIARLLKKGVEEYSKTPEGALYTYTWVLPKELAHVSGGQEILNDPMNEDPTRLIPVEWRGKAFDTLGIKADAYPLKLDGDLNPASRYIYRQLLAHYKGDWERVVNQHVRCRRLVLSEKDRVGIGTFQPKDEKNQDSTELTGDINYRKIAEIGSDSDPRAFNFDGEFNVANRGIIEFVEVLKLDVAFLYDLLGATQEQKIKPKKFAQTDIDEVILGHTNEPEYKKLQSNEFMEALRDRTIKVDVPYITKLSEETKIYIKDYNPDKIKKHIAPHTLEVAAMWAVLTRLDDPKKYNLSLMQKLKLYDGKSLTGFTQDNIKELRKEASREGMEGISPRFVQDKISNSLVSDKSEGSINPFLVLNEIEAGLKTHSLITNDEQRQRFRELLAMVKQEYEDIVKNEVQRAISADEEAISKLCGNYIDNVNAYTQKLKVRNRYTGQYEEPDERLMRSIEEKIEISESRKDDFRREIMNFIGSLAIDGKQFTYQTNERLHKALEMKLFEDQKDSIKLTSLVSSVVDKDTQAKIDIVKQRMIRNYGYNEESATDVLSYVASIFARGDVKD